MPIFIGIMGAAWILLGIMFALDKNWTQATICTATSQIWAVCAIIVGNMN